MPDFLKNYAEFNGFYIIACKFPKHGKSQRFSKNLIILCTCTYRLLYYRIVSRRFELSALYPSTPCTYNCTYINNMNYTFLLSYANRVSNLLNRVKKLISLFLRPLLRLLHQNLIFTFCGLCSERTLRRRGSIQINNITRSFKERDDLSSG